MTGKPKGHIKTTPEDFVVEEIPAYEPCGEGDHLFVRFTKRGLTTDEAAGRIARGAGVPMRDVGIAGMKDKVAVTTQTISLPIPVKAGAELEARVGTLSVDGITIHQIRRHTNKLRTGHLVGNRFAIVVRGIDPKSIDEVVSTLETVGREGLPNAFGAQRFGRDRDNADKARAWLSGRAPAPRDGRLRRLLFSSLQAELFNRVLDSRVTQGTWSTPLVGDLVKRRHSHAFILWTGAEDDPREKDPPSPTGPMFGAKMREPEGEPLELERTILRESLGEGVDLVAARALGEGTRRPLRLWVDELRIERLDPTESAGSAGPTGGSIRFYFVLPKGGYATSVLGTALALETTAEGRSDLLPPGTGAAHAVSHRS
jgi:tRNA pseudouridine13 synthase